MSLRRDDPTGNYSVSFYGQNILNQLYRSYTVPALGDIATYGMPATWGMELTAKFGPFRKPAPEAAPPVPAPEPAAPPPAPVVAAPEPQRLFQVFFDFDKSEITEAAARVIEAAAATVKAGNVARITVTGHTDTVGTDRYNQALSERRAAAVRDGLIADGVGAGEITTSGVGKRGLLVPTADGVREPQNRRAEIVLQ
jgi:outer membrane protein OmpA-like peptidoglycan-associated protein